MMNLLKGILTLDIPKKELKAIRNSDKFSKTQYDKWDRSEKIAEIGDWQCSWCDWKELCYPQSVFTEDVESGKLTIKEASTKLN